MGSNNKKHKDRESRKRRHRSPSDSYEDSSPKEKKHKHHHKHKHRRDKDKKKDKNKFNYISDDSDIVEVPVEDSVQKSSPQRTVNVEEPNTSKSSESLSIEETNKLRAKLGLKPLDLRPAAEATSSSNGSSRSKDTKLTESKLKDDWGEFYHKPADNWAVKAQQEKFRSKLAERKEKRELHSKISKVKTLGESDEEEDAASWIDKNRKIEESKKEAERRIYALELCLPFARRFMVPVKLNSPQVD